MWPARAVAPGFPLLNAPETDGSAKLWPSQKAKDWKQRLAEWAEARKKKERQRTVVTGFSPNIGVRNGELLVRADKSAPFEATARLQYVKPAEPRQAVHIRGDCLEDWE